MKHRDFSMIALIFFLTRAFFNLYNFSNIYNFLVLFIIILISIIIIKKIPIDLFKSKLFKLCYLIALSLIFIILLANTTIFINNNYFKFENYISIVISLFIISYFLGKDNIKTISSISEILLIIFIITSILIYIGLFSLIDIDNYNNYIKLSSISINFVPTLIVFIFLYLKNNNIVTGYILGSISILIDNFLIIGCLGTKMILKYKFPAISILKTLNYFHFINHIDKLFSFIYLFEYTISLSLVLNIFKQIKNDISK